MKIKIITEQSTDSLTDKVNEWLKRNENIEIISLTPYFTVLNERYNYSPDTIANQWFEYSMTILYRPI